MFAPRLNSNFEDDSQSGRQGEAGSNAPGGPGPSGRRRRRDVYFDSLVSTQPCHRDRAESAIEALYKSIGEKRPAIIWTPSPLAGLQMVIVAAWCLATRDRGSPSGLSPRAYGWWTDRTADLMEHVSLSMVLHPPEYRGRDPDVLQQRPSVRLCRVIMGGCEEQIWSRMGEEYSNEWLVALETFLHEIDDDQSYELSAKIFEELLTSAYMLHRVIRSYCSLGVANFDPQLDLPSARFRHPVLVNYGHFDTVAVPLPGEPVDASSDVKRHRLQLAARTVQECGIWWPLMGVAIVSERPSEIHLDAAQNLHARDRMAICFRDGFGCYAQRGTRISKRIAFGEFDVDDIDNTDNMELRRSMIEMYGIANYLRDTHAKEIHRDSFGVLYRKDQDGEEPLVMVELENKTPEPDGTYRKYFLRVPPTMRTARQAVAWSFGLTASEYKPTQES